MRSRSDRRWGRWVKWPATSLSLSLLLWLLGAILVAFSCYAWVAVRTTSHQWNQTVQNHAERLSELIRRSTHYSMLLNRKEDVHEIIRSLAATPGVAGVRVYDKQGTIIASGESREVGRQVDLQAEACVICHEQARPLRSVPEAGRARIYDTAAGGRVLGLISPIENARECHEAPCHAHPPAQSILGVLDVKMSLGEAEARLAAVKRQVIAAGVLMALFAGSAAAAFILVMVRRPVQRLIHGTRRVAAGDLTTELPCAGGNELAQLAGAFNTMTRELREAREELTRWSELLETRLVERTAELGLAQRQALHVEKMASLGKLAATVAHELNNPLAGIVTYAKLVDRTLGENPETAARFPDLHRSLDLIGKEATRCGSIVRNLLVFARRSGVEMALHSLASIIERAASVVRHHLEISNVRFVLQPPGGDDRIACDADLLQQALVALFVNAVEAMPSGGTLAVRATPAGEHVALEITDTGVGIPAAALPHIFEPFFTTKDRPDGAGLGLAVVFGIVQRHQGQIDVSSDAGRGTTFRIVLPRRQASAAAGAREVEHVGT